MTSFIPEYFEYKKKAEELARAQFQQWCSKNNKLKLTEWMSSKNVLSQDLFKSNIIEYFFCGIPSMPITITITDYGKRFIRVIPGQFFEFIELPNYQFSTDEHLGYCYITDEQALLEVLAKHLAKSEAERREDFKEEHSAKYGYPAPALQEELPFKYRDFVDGPFCDLEDAVDLDYEDKLNYFCHWCAQSLLRKPRFAVGQRVLCFKCSALAYRRLEGVSNMLNDRNLNLQSRQRSEHFKWFVEFEKHKKNKSLFLEIAELFSGDREAYIQKFLLANPEPKVDKVKMVVPSFRLLTTKQEELVDDAWVLERDEETCQLCGFDGPTSERFKNKVHQITKRSRAFPSSLGGRRTPSNLITLCYSCFAHREVFRKKLTEDQMYSLPDEPEYEWESSVLPDILMLSDDELMADPTLFEATGLVR